MGQAEYAMPLSEINGEGDYRLEGTSCWVIVEGFSVYVRRAQGRNGVEVEIYREEGEMEDAIDTASAYA